MKQFKAFFSLVFAASWIGCQGPEVMDPPAEAVSAQQAVQAATLYQAESATRSGPIVSSVEPGYTGTGYLDYQNASNDYIQWTVNVPSNQAYSLSFRHANGGTTSRPLRITADGAVFESGLPFPPTGSWRTWQLVTRTITLTAGSHTIRATAIGSSGSNIDYLGLEPIGGLPAAPLVGHNGPSTRQPRWTWVSGGGGAGTFRYRWAGSPTFLGEGTATVYAPANLPEAAFTLCVAERNAAGWGAEACAPSLRVDRTPPVLVILQPRNNFITNRSTATISYNVDGSAVRTFVCTLVDNAPTLCTRTETDAAGNASSVTRTIWRRSNVVFVKQGGTGDGSSWESASGDLAGMGTNPAHANREIWVASGNYGDAGLYAPMNLSYFGGFNANAFPVDRNSRSKGSSAALGAMVQFGNSVVIDGFTLGNAIARIGTLHLVDCVINPAGGMGDLSAVDGGTLRAINLNITQRSYAGSVAVRIEAGSFGQFIGGSIVNNVFGSPGDAPIVVAGTAAFSGAISVRGNQSASGAQIAAYAGSRLTIAAEADINCSEVLGFPGSAIDCR